MRSSTGWMAAALILVAGTGVVAWRFAFLVAPPTWTGEARALAKTLGVRPGTCVADIGAGDGAMAEAISAMVGASGRVLATELSAGRLRDLAARKARRGLANLEIVAARVDDTGLPEGGCDALYLRHVFHHLRDRPAMAARLTRATKTGGRIAVIDFPPDALWFHGADHGVSADEVADAFETAGWRQRARRDNWGGGTFLVVFERGGAPAGPGAAAAVAVRD